MTSTTHKQLCSNCDGYVHIYEIVCPYCGVALSEQKKESEEDFTQSNLSQSLEEKSAHVQERFEPPYPGYGAELNKVATDSAKQEEPSQEETTSSLKALIFLWPGTVFFLLGLTMLLFSSEGYLTFQFRSKFWFVYLLMGAPLLYAGYRVLFPKKGLTSSDVHHFTNPLER